MPSHYRHCARGKMLCRIRMCTHSLGALGGYTIWAARNERGQAWVWTRQDQHTACSLQVSGLGLTDAVSAKMTALRQLTFVFTHSLRIYASKRKYSASAKCRGPKSVSQILKLHVIDTQMYGNQALWSKLLKVSLLKCIGLFCCIVSYICYALLNGLTNCCIFQFHVWIYLFHPKTYFSICHH